MHKCYFKTLKKGICVVATKDKFSITDVNLLADLVDDTEQGRNHWGEGGLGGSGPPQLLKRILNFWHIFLFSSKK